MARFTVTTFGCQMNVHDSERLEEVLRRAGHEPIGTLSGRDGYDDAEIVVLNTCSVREKAEQKLRSEAGRLGLLKKQRPELCVVVAGCLAQQEGEKLLDSCPAVDLVIGPDNIPELPTLLADHLLGGMRQVRTVFDVDAPEFLTAPTAVSGRPTAFVTTMKGCNERCTYCIVPTTRGPERYRPSDHIVGEIAELVEGGVREVTLLGQTVNSYQDPLGALGAAPEADPEDPDESEFAALLHAIAERVPGLIRLRYTSPHPRHLTRSLIAAHRDLAVLPRHVHLPAQSGSDRMLKRMVRRYTRETYLDRVARLRAKVPDVTLSTDLIVGFSGETEEDFEDTLELMRRAHFTGIYAFKYSPRPFTPALKMGDDVPEEVKRDRLARLFALSDAIQGAYLETLVGTTQRVLVEGPSKSRPQNLTGRSERNEIVHLEDTGHLAFEGQLVEAEIVDSYRHSLLGRVAPEDLAAAAPKVASTAKRSLPVV